MGRLQDPSSGASSFRSAEVFGLRSLQDQQSILSLQCSACDNSEEQAAHLIDISLYFSLIITCTSTEPDLYMQLYTARKHFCYSLHYHHMPFPATVSR